jgi:hypothetical protein
LGANYRLWIEAAIVNSPGVNYMQNAFKLIAVSAKNQATGYGFGAALELRFGSLLTVEKFQIRVSVFDTTTGLLSGPVATSGAVVA